jgi:hypothetical protein
MKERFAEKVAGDAIRRSGQNDQDSAKRDIGVLPCLISLEKPVASRASIRDGASTSEEIAEELDELSKRLERCKVLFEQYFLGIQKTAPTTLHTELERRFRRLTQLNIRNTALRFRFSTLTQKFGSYNTYWKRTLRQIENGTYIRDIARVGRKAARTGEDIPEEILAKMPKRMRDRIERDRELARKRQELAEHRARKAEAEQETGKVRSNTPANVHHLDESDLMDDVDLDSIFSQMMSDDSGPAAEEKPAPAPKAEPAGKPAQRAEAKTDVDELFKHVHAQAKSAPAARKPAASKPAPRSAPAAQPAVSRAKPPPGMSEADADKLFKRYVKAKKLVGEQTTGVTYDRLMRSLNKQAPKILKDHNANGVDFEVVVRGERVVLKAKPKK